MKMLRTLVAAGLFSTAAFAQNFEGTINWSFRTEATEAGMQQSLQGARGGAAGPNQQQMQQAQAMMNDPAIRQQMAQAQAMLNDPAIQAQLQAAMSDPRVKAMMEGRGGLGAMMGGAGGSPGMPPAANAAAAAAASSNPIASMMPKGMTLRIKGGNSLVVSEGGIVTSEILTQAGKQEAYMLDRVNRAYTTLTSPPTAPNQAPTYKVTKTNETATILNYRAQKYLVELTGPEAAAMSIWTTTELPGVSARELSRMQIGRGGDSAYMKDLEGVPVKMEIGVMGMKMVMEVTSVRREPLSDDLFRIPAGFVERK